MERIQVYADEAEARKWAVPGERPSRAFPLRGLSIRDEGLMDGSGVAAPGAETAPCKVRVLGPDEIGLSGSGQAVQTAVTVGGNTVYSNDYYGISGSGPNLAILNNLVYDNARKGISAAGSGLAVYREKLRPYVRDKARFPRRSPFIAAEVGRIGCAMVREGKGVAAAALEPLYFRRSQAEEKCRP